MAEERELEALRLTDSRENTNEEISSRTEKLRNQAKAQIIKTRKYHFLAKNAKMKLERYQEIYAKLPATIQVNLSGKEEPSAALESQKDLSKTTSEAYSAQDLSETSSIREAARAQNASHISASASAANQQGKSFASPKASADGKSMTDAVPSPASGKNTANQSAAPQAMPPASKQKAQTATAESKPSAQKVSIPNPKKAVVEQLLKQAEQAYQHWVQLANQEYQIALQQRLAYEKLNSSTYSN